MCLYNDGCFIIETVYVFEYISIVYYKRIKLWNDHKNELNRLKQLML